MSRTFNFEKKIRSLIIVSLSGVGAFAAISLYKGDEKFYRNWVMPVVHKLDPENAHRFAIYVSKYNLIPKNQLPDIKLLNINILGKEFTNPLGIAAGFDKHAEAVSGLKDIGFGFVEVGSVTPLPQPGNEKPRVFRLPEDQAIINRYGFNSEGHEKVYDRLLKIRENKNVIIGVNLGKNKTSHDPISDYVEGIKKFAGVADYLVINISSPNTPGLRNLQNKAELKNLLQKLIETRNSLPENMRPPLLLKLAPDLSYQERSDVADVIKEKDCKVDGLIVSNTTICRPADLKNTKCKGEIGGLSGGPLKDMSTEMIADMYRLTNGIAIIGVGGIFSGKDAYDKIKAGASLIQLYTSFVYGGPPIVSTIKKELAELLESEGYKNVAEAVGKSVR